MDFLFKCYFVFFRKKADKGASAAVVGLSVPLGFISYLLVLLILSYVIDLKDIGGPLFGFMAGLIVFLVGVVLRHVYVTKERYRKIAPIKYAFIYYLIGIVFYVGATLTFFATFVSLADNQQQQ